MTKAEYMRWCKQRALKELDSNPRNAIMSLLSDFNKRQEDMPFEFAKIMGTELANDDVDIKKVKEFINGFCE